MALYCGISSKYEKCLGSKMGVYVHKQLKNQFGTKFDMWMYLQHYKNGANWYDGEITTFKSLEVSPAAAVLHYGQSIFEGLKAYRNSNDKVFLFRPKDNLKRFNDSAKRMAMPQIDVDTHLKIIIDLVLKNKSSIPVGKEGALYIRPTMIATDNSLNVGASSSYSHYVITGPVASYFSNKEITCYVSTEHFRAVPGGVGNVKTAGNYAASYLVSEKAKLANCDQVLWLDPRNGKNVEEVGAMNIFFAYSNGELKTPALSGSILPGITRDSVIQLARSEGVQVSEETLNIDNVIKDIQSGKIVEIFGTGTAASITSIGALEMNGENVRVKSTTNQKFSSHLKSQLLGIQYGEFPEGFGWVIEL